MRVPSACDMVSGSGATNAGRGPRRTPPWPASTVGRRLCDTARVTSLDTAPPALDADAERVHAAIDALLADVDPRATDNVVFRRARFEAGLAWVQFPVGYGGLGARPELNSLVERRLRAAGAAPT